MHHDFAACLLVAGSAACSFHPPGTGSLANDAAVADASAVTGGDASDCLVLPFAPINFDPCDVGDIGPGLTIEENSTIDSARRVLESNGLADVDLTATSAVIQQNDGPELLVLALSRLRIEAQVELQVIGARPLIIVATEDMHIAGTLHAGAVGPTDGLGANSAQCGAGGTGETQTVPPGGPSAGTGGGGGGYGKVGASGAAVANSGGGVRPGGSANGDPSMVPLRGGCRGGRGGHPASGQGGGPGGGGGGAIQLVAAQRIDVEAGGVITAHGGGGQGASRNYAGGGGGSGGAIVLEAVDIDIAGAVAANGGGGGEGARGGGRGNPGQDGRTDSDAVAVGGNAGAISGGDGGNGGAGTQAAGPGFPGINDLLRAGGSGGGGGSVGRVRLLHHGGELSVTGTVSPSPG